MRNRTGLPAYAPGCTVSDRSPSIDRFKLDLISVPIGVDQEGALRSLRRLNPDYFGRGRYSHGFRIKASALLFGGEVWFDPSPSDNPTISARLEMNLTRFLSHTAGRLPLPRELILLDQVSRLSLLRRTATDDLGSPRSLSLNDDDNFIPDEMLRCGLGNNQLQWLVPYIELCLSFIAGEIETAMGAGPQRSVQNIRPHVVIPLRNWAFRQLEVYWEFGSASAVVDASDIASIVERVAIQSDLTRYSRHQDKNVVGISATVGQSSTRNRIYAKLSNRIRFEVAYMRGTRRIERRIPLADIGNHDATDMIWYMSAICDRAARRIDNLSQSLPSHSLGVSGPVSRTHIVDFFEALARASDTPNTFGFIIRQLIATGAVSRSRSDPGAIEASLTLERGRVFRGAAPGLLPTRTAFLPAPPYDQVVAGLRSLTTRQPANEPISDP